MTYSVLSTPETLGVVRPVRKTQKIRQFPDGICAAVAGLRGRFKFKKQRLKVTSVTRHNLSPGTRTSGSA